MTSINLSIKRQKKEVPTTCYPQNNIDTDRLKVNGWKKIHHINTTPQKTGKMLMLNKRDFRTMNINRDTEKHYTMRKGLILE